jgi:hypothetical protein
MASKKEEALIALIVTIFIEAILFVPMGKVWTELFNGILKIGEIVNIELPPVLGITIFIVQFIVMYFIIFLIVALILGLTSPRWKY